MKEIKMGIIGIGNIGSAHLRCIHNGEIKGMKVTAVCDEDLKRLEMIKTQYPDLALYSDYENLLEKADIDGVLIAVPHPFHAKLAISAFQKGKHVLVEKPVDITISQAEKLNLEAEKSGKVFGIMFNQRTNELFSRARQIVQSGELGELKRSVWIITNWYRTQHYYDSGNWRATWQGEGGGVLLNQAPHNLDLWQWICGMPESITAFCNVAKFHNIEVEDEATICATYKNGATGLFITSTGDYPGTNRLEISGTRGKLVIEDGTLKYWKLKADEREVCKDSNENFCQIDSEYTEYRSDKESAHKGILQNFANAVLYDEELLAPGYEGIYELTISNAAYLSEWMGNQKISIPFEAEKFNCLLEQRQASSKLKERETKKLTEEYNARWQVRW